MASVEPITIVKATNKCSNVNIVNGNDKCKCNVENFSQGKNRNVLRKYIRLLMWIILAIVVFLLIRSFFI